MKPLESHDIIAVSDHDEERKLLRRAVLNPVCAHPECDATNVEGHHLFPRSYISNSSWYVRIPGVEKPILHVSGLCRLHHDRVEMHDGWVKLEDGVWNWYDRVEFAPERPWVLLGPLDPQPGQVGAGKKRKPGKKKGEVRPYRAQWSVSVPQDERENGADVLDELELAVREKWASELGWSDTAPRYVVVAAALMKALQ